MNAGGHAFASILGMTMLSCRDEANSLAWRKQGKDFLEKPHGKSRVFT